MAAAQKADGGRAGTNSHLPSRISFQIEADIRKGPPSSAVIKLHGPIGAQQNGLIERIMSPLLKGNVKYVIVDLADVPSIERAPVETLVEFARNRIAAGARYSCSLTGLKPAVVEGIKEVKPGKVFVVYKHLRDAIESLKLEGLPDLYVAGTKPSGLNMRVMVKIVPRGGRVALVSPYGYVQQQEAELLGRILRRVSLMEIRNVVIDMAGISYANSHALGSLINCASAWQEVYGRKAVALAGTKPGILMALTTLGIGRSTFMCEDVDAALNKLEEEEKRAISARHEPVEEQKEEEKAGGKLRAELTEEEETPFSLLSAKECVGTDAWILKNVQSILKKEKQAQDEQ